LPWPKTIDFGQSGAAVENGRKTEFSKAEIAKGYWPPLSSGQNTVASGPLRSRFYPRPADHPHADPFPAGIRHAPLVLPRWRFICVGGCGRPRRTIISGIGGVPMIPPSGTFDYLVIVPKARSEGGFECRAETRGPVVCKGSNLADARLVGISVARSSVRAQTWQMPGWSASLPRFASPTRDHQVTRASGRRGACENEAALRWSRLHRTKHPELRRRSTSTRR